MNYAIIENGVVTNVIVIDTKNDDSVAFAKERGAIPLKEGFGLGDFFDGVNWTNAPIEPPTEPEPNYMEFLVGFFEGYIKTSHSDGTERELGITVGEELANVLASHR